MGPQTAGRRWPSRSRPQRSPIPHREPFVVAGLVQCCQQVTMRIDVLMELSGGKVRQPELCLAKSRGGRHWSFGSLRVTEKMVFVKTNHHQCGGCVIYRP